LPGYKRADLLRDIAQLLRNVAEIREHLQQKGNAAAVWLSAKGKHEVKLSGRQQEMLNQLFVGVRRMETRIGFTHGGTSSPDGSIFP
jgi:hypothetical protein